MFPKSIAIIGAGGKTTLLGLLARACRAQRVLVTTTTHIYPFDSRICDRLCIDPDEQTLRAALSVPGAVCAGRAAQAGKLTGLPDVMLAQARGWCDHLFYEADGAARQPLKLHRSDEPVMLPGTACCVLVAGLSALGQPVGACVHRFARNPAWANAPGHLVSAEDVLFCIREGLAASGSAANCVLLSQADAADRHQAGDRILRQLARDGVRAAYFDRDAPHDAFACLRA